MARRMLSIWLPDFAMDRWRRGLRHQERTASLPRPARDEPPAVLTETGARGHLITAANASAKRLGIGPFMRLADARAICPDLGTDMHDNDADQALLSRMADGMLRFTPWVSVNGADGLMLDVTGCAHLQGGERGLMDAVAALLSKAGFAVRLGLADTLGAAWAAARFGGEPERLIPEAKVADALAPMPLAALRLSADTTQRLRGLGLKSIGQVMAIDRASLMRRFPADGSGPGLLLRLDQVLGLRDEPLSPREEAPEYRVRVTPLEPYIDLAGIENAFRDLLGNLMGLLQRDGRGARHLTLRAFRADGPVIALPVGLARASRNAAHIARLFAERLQTIDPGFGIDTLMLSAETTEPIAPAQPALDGSTASDDTLERLIDRIANRIGPDRIHTLAPVASHLPERAATRADALETTGSARPLPPRPLTLFARPETIEVMAEIPEGPPLSFRWRRVRHRVIRATGPERLAPEWWRDLAEAARTRDYYTVEDTGGGRYWLYRDGLYQEADLRGRPDWFLHGIFA